MPAAGAAAPRGRMPDFDIDYTEGLKVGYKWFDAEGKQPLFPFGHGLSYTTFAYSGLKAAIDSVTFTVRNTGKRAGRGDRAGLRRPAGRRQRTAEAAGGVGESRAGCRRIEDRHAAARSEVPFDLRRAERRLELLPGEYKIFVGGSSRNTPLTGVVTR